MFFQTLVDEGVTSDQSNEGKTIAHHVTNGTVASPLTPHDTEWYSVSNSQLAQKSQSGHHMENDQKGPYQAEVNQSFGPGEKIGELIDTPD